ncbi:hypothetical protein [Chitinophaga qingshengii]|uniref:Uncharacterized protein n=1 Tax=Chitinophaga qingshengii TaxID=1569794 RepID=A0ABR7TR21_9BACT|nr:hypothetical protein [Chitinophaga qingshengii]MBC9932944.1 hypothetical protein [Chitinophaga qingshengii]
MKSRVSSKFLLVYSSITTVALAMMLMAFKNMKESFEEIDVKKINIVDEKGKPVLIISNKDKMPPPVINGKTYKRAISPAGLLFLDEKGDECGGLAITDMKEANIRALAFDYSNADALGMIVKDGKTSNTYTAGLLINDKDTSGKPGMNISRIALTTEDGNAGLVINGPDEKPRIKILVDKQGNPVINVLDEKGKVVKSLVNLK